MTENVVGVERAAAVAAGNGIALKQDAGSRPEGGHGVGGAEEECAGGEGEQEPAGHIQHADSTTRGGNIAAPPAPL